MHMSNHSLVAMAVLHLCVTIYYSRPKFGQVLACFLLAMPVGTKLTSNRLLTEGCISHEPITTTQRPSQPSHTECRISHEPVTTTQDCTETTPLISHNK